MTIHQMKRLLHEFPFLMALPYSKAWDFKRDSITVETVTFKELDAEHRLGWQGFTYSTPYKWEGEVEGTFELKIWMPGWTNSLGSGARCYGGPGIQYIILYRSDKNQEARILRAPKGKTLWEILERYYPKPQA